MKNIFVRWIASAIALLLLTQANIGIKAEGVVALLVAVVALGFANAVIRPLIMFFAWPINCLTFGLLGFAINVLLFGVVGSGIVPGFAVTGTKTISAPLSALIGTVGMSVISGLFNFFLKDRGDRDN